jgi:sugar fermentation stimulation protein A
VAAGVEVLAYGVMLTPEQMWVDRALPVLLEPLQLDPDALLVLPAV